MDLFESAGTDDAGLPVDAHAPLVLSAGEATRRRSGEPGGRR